MLPAQHRLSSAEDFRLAVRTGHRAGGRLVVVHTVTTSIDGSGVGCARIGLVVSKAVGPAVVRTRVKRRLRHLMREHLAALPAGQLVVLRAQPAAASASYAELVREVSRCLRRAGVLDTRSVPS